MPYTFRDTVKYRDLVDFKGLLESCQVFSKEEIDLALADIKEDGLGKVGNSTFLICDYHDPVNNSLVKPVGYAQYEKLPLTTNSWILYWIAVHADHRKSGIGSQLLTKVEDEIKVKCNQQLYIETSGRVEFLKTRQFYKKNGYYTVGYFDGYYGPDDAKVIYVKKF
jgi:ribosomal protein S18 acetylase RimI-like enzyme